MVSKGEFEDAIRSVCSAETSAHSDEWTPENPFWGHCTIVSLIAQDFFGGDVLRVDLRKIAGFEKIAWHSWNRFPDGEEKDFTISQFLKPLPRGLVPLVKVREELFTYPTIQKRYELLKSKLLETQIFADRARSTQV